MDCFVALLLAMTGNSFPANRFGSQTLRSQAIITTRHEIDKSAVAQILKLLTYLGLDVLVAGIEIAKMPLECVDLVKREVALPQRLHAFHYVEQPAARFRDSLLRKSVFCHSARTSSFVRTIPFFTI